MNAPIKIGTRESELALWQAKAVQEKLKDQGIKSILVPLKSSGDLVLNKPLYEFGITGVFTKELDVALLKGEIDIAVHSLKDVPTLLPKGVVQAAILKRETPFDVLVHKGTDFLTAKGTVATGSLRRKAQWLNNYPDHKIESLRGNVNTRLKKLETNAWDGAIFAQAGLQRIGLLPKNALQLDWMIPAPAQGAIMVAALSKNQNDLAPVFKLNHGESELCTAIEREFLRTLEGGCTAPIGAHAVIKNQTVYFQGVLLSTDGKTKLTIEKNTSLNALTDFGKDCAEEILGIGGRELMQTIRDEINPVH